VGARAAEGQRTVVITLDVFQQIQNAVGGLGAKLIGLVVRFLILLRVETPG